jgi:hypothetical protein
MTTEPTARRSTVSLTVPNEAAVRDLAAATGLNKTDVINRAIRLYLLVHRAESRGGEVLVRHEADGEVQRVYFL